MYIMHILIYIKFIWVKKIVSYYFEFEYKT